MPPAPASVAAGNLYTLLQPASGASEVDLLVASTGAAVPRASASYVLTMIYGTGDAAAAEQLQFPTVPDWLATTGISDSVTSPNGMLSRQESAMTMSYYNSGSPVVSKVSTAAHLYVLRFGIDPTMSAGPLTAVTLPAADGGQRLHVLAIATH